MQQVSMSCMWRWAIVFCDLLWCTTYMYHTHAKNILGWIDLKSFQAQCLSIVVVCPLSTHQIPLNDLSSHIACTWKKDIVPRHKLHNCGVERPKKSNLQQQSVNDSYQNGCQQTMHGNTRNSVLVPCGKKMSQRPCS